MEHPTKIPAPVASFAVALVTAAAGPDDGTYERLVASLGVRAGSDADWALRGLVAVALAALGQLDESDRAVPELLGALGLSISAQRG